MWLRPRSRAMHCSMGLELCIGQTVMTVRCEGSDAEQVMFASSSRLHLLPSAPVCGSSTLLTRGEDARHFLWAAVPHRLISSFLSSLIFSVYPWSLCLSGCLSFSLLVHLSSHCFLCHSSEEGEEEREGETIECGGKKKKKLYAVTMATASRSWASTLPQACVFPLSFSLCLPYLD